MAGPPLSLPHSAGSDTESRSHTERERENIRRIVSARVLKIIGCCRHYKFGVLLTVFLEAV